MTSDVRDEIVAMILCFNNLVDWFNPDTGIEILCLGNGNIVVKSSDIKLEYDPLSNSTQHNCFSPKIFSINTISLLIIILAVQIYQMANEHISKNWRQHLKNHQWCCYLFLLLILHLNSMQITGLWKGEEFQSCQTIIEVIQNSALFYFCHHWRSCLSHCYFRFFKNMSWLTKLEHEFRKGYIVWPPCTKSPIKYKRD